VGLLLRYEFAQARLFVYHAPRIAHPRPVGCAPNTSTYAGGPPAQEIERVAATYNREQIRAALAQTDPALSFYLDLETGSVVRIDDSDSSPATEELRNQVMDGYGDRYRYIPGGNSDANAVAAWMEAEGI
jgi:hypothetical protein